eukprot:3940973-Rhodomonas_salina.3
MPDSAAMPVTVEARRQVLVRAVGRAAERVPGFQPPFRLVATAPLLLLPDMTWPVFKQPFKQV